MYVCDRCQKGLQVGMNVSHSHIRTKKRSLPNLHVITVKVSGKNKTMRLCTKCTRIIRTQHPHKIEEKVDKTEVKKTIEAKKSETPETVSQTT